MKNNTPDSYSLLLDYKGLLSVFWKDKYLIIVIILISLPFSINYISKKPPIYSAQAIIDVSQTSPSNNTALLPQAVPLFQFEKQSISFLPKVTGNEFLKSVVLNNEKIEKRVKDLCEYSKGEISFLRTLLIRAGLSTDVKPNEQQKQDLLINCVKDMLAVKEYTHDGTLKTPAHIISVEAPNPFFAADLANEIVIKFFAFEKAESEEYSEKLSRQLTQMMERAQVALNEKEEKLEEFTIKHAGLIGKNSTYVQQSDDSKALRFALRSQIYKLSQSEEYEIDLKDLILKLRRVATEDINNIYDLVQTTGITGGLSSEFVFVISEFQKRKLDTIKEKSDISSSIEKEILRLNNLVKKNEKLLADKEVKVESLMELSNELNRVELQVVSKKAYIKTLENQIASNTLEAGLMKLKDGQLLTKATPPLYPIGPNKKRIMALFIITFGIIGFSFSLLKQSIKNKVYHVGQLQVLGNIKNLVQASRRRRNLFFGILGNSEEMKSQLDFKFFSDLLMSSKIGCVVDVRSKTGSKFNAAEEISTQIGLSVFQYEKSILLFKSGGNDKLSLNSEHGKNAYSENQRSNRKGEENLFVKRVDRSIIEEISVSSLRGQFKEYDRVIISLDHTVDDAFKMKFMREVDYYILVGIAGIVDMNTLRKFVQISGEEKCLGICIIK